MPDQVTLEFPSGVKVTGTPEQVSDVARRLGFGYYPIHPAPSTVLPTISPCRGCSAPIGIVGPWTCSECGRYYPNSTQTYVRVDGDGRAVVASTA